MHTHYDSLNHCNGTSQYISDLKTPKDYLWVYPFWVPCAHARLKRLDFKQAKKAYGIEAIITYKDIPGENQIGSIIPDEPLLAQSEIHYWGQTIALLVGTSLMACQDAAKLIAFELEELEVVTCPKIAAHREQLLFPAVTSEMGDCESAFTKCQHIIENEIEIQGQEHLYLEGQGAICLPEENGYLKVISSTQGPTAVQKAIARVLKLGMHQIEVSTKRLGGGFGGKEDQATPWAVQAALASVHTGRPTKLILPRHDDMILTGKRHPYKIRYKIGFDQEGIIEAYAADFYQNGGAATDLSPGVLGRTLFHATNAYQIPNVKVRGFPARTNLPPSTAFRGFGGPQGKFAIEAAIAQIGDHLQIPAWKVQKANLMQEGYTLHYGQKVKDCKASETWHQLEDTINPSEIEKRVLSFNSKQSCIKKGLAYMPICFGISFTKTSMNQASSLVHIYHDGSISVSTTAVEMGQGVQSKMKQVALEIFKRPAETVTTHDTNTTRNANTSPTAASTGADLNGKATEKACLMLKKRLEDFLTAHHCLQKQEAIDFTVEGIWVGSQKLEWLDVINDALENRINLSAHAYYSTPDIHFDSEKGSGSPFAYHVYGTSLTEVSVDCLRGRYTIDHIWLVHDYGQVMNQAIDFGQVEGALVQGVGWMTLEDLQFDQQTGKLLANTLSTYKVPDFNSAPKKIDNHPLKNSSNPMGIFNSKAVGEPPLMYGIGTYFAIRNAILAFDSNAKQRPIKTPYTPENVMADLYNL